MNKNLEKRLKSLVGEDYLNKDFNITSNINSKRVRGSVRMILNKIYTPQKREQKINEVLSIKLPR